MLAGEPQRAKLHPTDHRRETCVTIVAWFEYTKLHQEEQLP